MKQLLKKHDLRNMELFNDLFNCCINYYSHSSTTNVMEILYWIKNYIGYLPCPRTGIFRNWFVYISSSDEIRKTRNTVKGIEYGA